MEATKSLDRLARLSASYDRHGPGAYVLAVRILGDREDGATVVLDTFVGLAPALASLDDPDAERRLIYREVMARGLGLLRERASGTHASTKVATSSIEVAVPAG